MGEREKKYVHMLNATLCATGRAICCLLETYQEADGVRVPEVLVPFMGGITFLPFIRDSRPPEKGSAPAAAPAAKEAPKQPKETKEAPKEPKEPKPAAEKKEKAAPAPAAAAPAAPAAAAPLPTPAPAAAAKEDKSKPPAVPVLAPKYTTPAPAVRTAAASSRTMSAASVPTAEEVLTAEGKPVLAALDARLMYFSYVGGFQPAAVDAKVSAAVSALPAPGLDASAFPNVARWLRSVQSFSADEVAQWA